MTLLSMSRPAALVMAVALPVAAMLARWLIEANVAGTFGYVLSWAAVVVPAILGGLVPGLVAIIAVALLEVFVAPLLEVGAGITTPMDAIRLAVFLASAVGVAWLSEVALRRRLAAENARAGEFAARVAAEKGRQRMEMLIEAGRVLGTTLDYDRTLAALVKAPIPLLGEYSIIDILEGTRVRRLVATSMSGNEAVVEGLQSHPLDVSSDNPIATTIRTGHTTVLTIDDPLLVKIARDQVHLNAARAAGLREALIVPLRSGERVSGAILLATRDPDRHYDGDDILVAQVLAQRSAKAIDNARLHQEVRRLASDERERAAELTQVIGAIGEGIVLFDGQGRVRTQNVAAERMLGGPLVDWEDLQRRLSPSEPPLPPPLVEYGPAEHQLAASPSPWLELSAYPLPHTDGREPATRGSVMIARDVTAFRQGQSLREAFLSLLSHELRTPVTSIYAAATVLGKRADQLDPATRSDILADIVGESDRLFRLIEDLLVLARFDEGLILSGEPSLLQRVVPSVVDAERIRWPQAGFNVQSGRDLPAVAGDETSIQQIVRNLLSNGVKYGPVGQEILVDIREESDGVAVRVLDRGPGIPADEAESLFRPFFRGPSTSGGTAGAGIGLFVCRRLIEAMGGRIWAVARSDGPGSEFGFWLPRYESGPDDEPSAGEPAPALIGER
jgi:signal transduction histidine kinase